MNKIIRPSKYYRLMKSSTYLTFTFARFVPFFQLTYIYISYSHDTFFNTFNFNFFLTDIKVDKSKNKKKSRELTSRNNGKNRY